MSSFTKFDPRSTLLPVQAAASAATSGTAALRLAECFAPDDPAVSRPPTSHQSSSSEFTQRSLSQPQFALTPCHCAYRLCRVRQQGDEAADEASTTAAGRPRPQGASHRRASAPRHDAAAATPGAAVATAPLSPEAAQQTFRNVAAVLRGTTERDLLRAGAAMLIRLWPATGTPENRWAHRETRQRANCVLQRAGGVTGMRSTPSPAHGCCKHPGLQLLDRLLCLRCHDV